MITATEEEPVTALVERMIHHQRTRIPVVRGEGVVGIVTRHDLLHVMAEHDPAR